MSTAACMKAQVLNDDVRCLNFFCAVITTIVTATTVKVTWTQSASGPVKLTLNRIRGGEGAVCSMVKDARLEIPIEPETSIMFVGLEEYSTYEARIMNGTSVQAEKNFTTLSARKYS